MDWNEFLHEAISERDVDLVRQALAQGADPTIEGWVRRTPLDRAQERKRGDGPRIYELLEQAAKRF